jgi:cobalt-precorrin-5B (C1)-methyltransferase
LHSGLTTGTCATAAAVADLQYILTGTAPNEVSVELPNGETISVPVTYGNGYASCWKDAGDDPDVTNGLEIRAAIAIDYCPTSTDDCSNTYNVQCIHILGGEGVGRFTLPGFDYPPGEPAINKGPREMIRRNLQLVVEQNLKSQKDISSQQDSRNLKPQTISVTISVPLGEDIARRTFNPRLGIEGGISIIGVSGIVKPFSEEAFVSSIRKCMEVAKASGTKRVVLNSGGKSERFISQVYPTLPRQAFVQYGNYIDDALRMADELAFPTVTLGMMLGKAVKLADGHLDTHSRKAVMNEPFIAQMMREAQCPPSAVDAFLSPEVTLARELWHIVPQDCIEKFCQVVISHCYAHTCQLLPNGQLTILLIDEDGSIHSTDKKIITNTTI